jgi:hypothetical protein
MATQDPTTNYSWNLPDDGGDSGTWGTLLNAIIGDDSTGIDAVVKDVSDVADAALPKAGGQMTGQIDATTTAFGLNALGNISGTQTLDADVNNAFEATVTGTITLLDLSTTSTGAVYVTLRLQNGGAYDITWASDINWPGGTAPTLTSSGTDILTFYTDDSGTRWWGALAMSDLS